MNCDSQSHVPTLFFDFLSLLLFPSSVVGFTFKAPATPSDSDYPEGARHGSLQNSGSLLVDKEAAGHYNHTRARR